jgi:hypothetical protein
MIIYDFCGLSRTKWQYGVLVKNEFWRSGTHSPPYIFPGFESRCETMARSDKGKSNINLSLDA